MKTLKTLLLLIILASVPFAFPVGKGSPGGADGSIQYNNDGLFGGSGLFRWDNPTNTLIINGGRLEMFGSVVRGGLAPDEADAYDLGSESFPWAGAYLGGDECLYFGNIPVMCQEVGRGDTIVDASNGKAVRIVRPLILNNLPDFDPHSAGHVWNDNGTLKISNGG